MHATQEEQRRDPKPQGRLNHVSEIHTREEMMVSDEIEKDEGQCKDDKKQDQGEENPDPIATRKKKAGSPG
jgi:hypothetical protein